MPKVHCFAYTISLLSHQFILKADLKKKKKSAGALSARQSKIFELFWGGELSLSQTSSGTKISNIFIGLTEAHAAFPTK